MKLYFTNYLATTINPITAVKIIIIGGKNFSSLSLLNFASKNGARKAPQDVPSANRKTSFQLTLPNPKCIKNPTTEIPTSTNTDVPTISKALHPKTIKPATIGVVPLMPTKPDITPPNRPKNKALHKSKTVYFLVADELLVDLASLCLK